MLAYKGISYNEEVTSSNNAFNKLFIKLDKVESKELVSTTQDNTKENLLRYYLVIKKYKSTPIIYPRLKNLIKTKPL